MSSKRKKEQLDKGKKKQRVSSESEHEESASDEEQGIKGPRDSDYNMALPTELEEFDMDEIIFTPGKKDGFEPDKLWIFFGKRRTGKSYTLTEILQKEIPAIGLQLYQIFEGGLVVTGTKMNQWWQKFFPNAYVHESLEVIPIFMEEQEKFIEEWHKHPEWQDPTLDTYVNPYRILIIDDMVGDHNFKYAESITQLFIKGRHYKIMVMITTQYAKLVNTVGRDNVDLLVLFFQSTHRSKETIAEEFMSQFDKREAMRFVEEHTVVDEETGRRDVMIINSMRLVNDPVQRLKKYSPGDIEDFIIGTRGFWKDEPERFDEFYRNKRFKKKSREFVQAFSEEELSKLRKRRRTKQ